MAIVEYESPVEVLTETEKRARTLEAAALEIEVRGHASCDCDSSGRVCANGGLYAALGWEPSFTNAVNGSQDPFKPMVRSTWGRGYGYIPLAEFNDKHSAEEATFLLRWRAEEIRDGWDA